MPPFFIIFPSGFVRILVYRRLLEICNKLGDNCIQNFLLRRYIVGYTVGNLVLRGRASGAVKRDFRTHNRRYISQMKILNMVIPILQHFYSLVSNRSVASRIKQHVTQRNVTLLMTSNYFQQYIAGYTVAFFDVIQSDVALLNQVY